MDDSYKKLVDTAYNLHVAGKYEDAKAVYEKLLSLKPDDLDVQNLYAQLNTILKNYDKAQELFEHIYEQTHILEVLINLSKVHFYKGEYSKVTELLGSIQNKDYSILSLLALSYTKLEDYNNSINIYLQILNQKEVSFSDYFNLSVAYLKTEDYTNSLKYALEAYKLDDKDLNINLHLAHIYDTTENYEKALEHLLYVSKIRPNVDLFYRIGVMYKKLKNDEMAIQYFNAIVEVEPDNKNALLNIASIYMNHDRNVALEIYRKLLEKEPNDKSLLEMFYVICVKMSRYQEALELAYKIAELSDEGEGANIYIADVLYDMFRFDEAEKYYNRLALLPDKQKSAEAKLIRIYLYSGRTKEAAELAKKYLDDKDIRCLYAYIKCTDRNIEEVRDYMHEHLTEVLNAQERNDAVNDGIYMLNLDKKFGITQDMVMSFHNLSGQAFVIKKMATYLKKNFYGKDITGKRVLLYSDAGAGDAIMFSRYIHYVEERASHVMLQLPKNLRSLFEYNFPNIEILDDDYIVDSNLYDYSASIFQLLTCLNMSLKDIEGSEGYLKVDNKLVEEKSKLECFNTEKKKVGLFWQGNPIVIQSRSIKLEKMLPLFEINNIQYYSFQISKFDYESAELKQKIPLIDLAPHIKNYADTGALLKNIDLLITIDTSIANLAGAMGINTYLLLPYDAEWRWFRDTETTPWYKSIRIFRQEEPNNWDKIIQRVKHELEL